MVKADRRSVSRILVALALCVGAMGLVEVATPSIAGAVTPTLTVTNAVTGLDHPWDLVFTPDGTMLFTQRPGAVDALVGGATRQLAFPADVDPQHERGMLGIVVDPNFAANRNVYTCFASDIAGPTDVRVARWTVDAGYTALSNRTDIITGIPVGPSANRHVGCRLVFGPDGYLWVTTGDGTIGTAPQDKHSLAGKVLRVDRDGNGAPGNPGGAFLPQIYTYGHRNPQGISFRPSDGKAYEDEHGPTCDDEINLLVPGGNYGWDPTVGASTSYNESVPMTDKTRHPEAIDAVWSSGCPTIAPSGATFLHGSQWGDWDGAYAMAVLKDSELRIMSISADGKSVAAQSIQFQGTYGRLRTAVQGPDGDLYIPRDEDAPTTILKIHPSNAPPPTPSGFVGLNPVRALDTRFGPVPSGRAVGQKLDTDATLDLPVAGAYGVPSNASSVVLNVTSTDALTSLAYVTAYPTGWFRPNTSNLNLQPGANVANSVTVAPGFGGKVSFFTNVGSTHLVVDVLGYYTTSGGDRFTAISPRRVMDTRTGPVPAGEIVGQKLNGGDNMRLAFSTSVVPADASAVAVNITSTQATSDMGYVTAWPAGTTRPTASNINVQPGFQVAGLAIVKLGTNDAIDLYTNAGATHLVVDLVGYYRPNNGAKFVPVASTRMFDSRSDSPLGAATRTATMSGQGVSGDATAVVLNATATQASSAGGFMTVWANGDPMPSPLTSNINYRPPYNVANQVMTKVGTSDGVSLENGDGTVHLVLDAAGYFIN